MSFLTANYDENQQTSYGALPTGEYEMVINKAYEDASPSGSENLTIDLVVRNDLEKAPALAETNGKFANRHVFNANWKRKATNQYDMKSFQYILEALDVPEGTVINSIDDFINLLQRKPVLVYIKEEKDTYKNDGSTRNQVAPWNYKQSKFPQMNHQFKDEGTNTTNAADDSPFEKNDNATDISDNDFPF